MNGDGATLQVDPILAAPMTLRLVPQGDGFALERTVECGPGELLVEFYDRRYAREPGFTPWGQFIRRYCAPALLARGEQQLILSNAVPQWALDAATMARVTDWIRAGIAAHPQAA